MWFAQMLVMALHHFDKIQITFQIFTPGKHNDLRPFCHISLYYVSAIVRLTSIPFWVSGYTEGYGLVFYSIMTHVYAQYYQKTNYGFQKHVVIAYATCHSIRYGD